MKHQNYLIAGIIISVVITIALKHHAKVTSTVNSDTINSGLHSLHGLFNKYLGVNSFVSAIFIKTINCMGKLLECHLNEHVNRSCTFPIGKIKLLPVPNC